MALIAPVNDTKQKPSGPSADTLPLQDSFAALLKNADPSSRVGQTREAQRTGPLPPGLLIGATEPDIEAAEATPLYTATLPRSTETKRPYFSENSVPMNTVVVSHNTEHDAEGGKAIVRTLYQANPNVKIALLVQDYDKRDPSQLAELADYYGVPESALAPIRVDHSTRGNSRIGMWPQDGFMAGANGLREPTRGTRHAGDTAEALSRATGIPVRDSDYIGMGGDTHFLTRPDGTQVAYFGPETIDHAAVAFSKNRPANDFLEPRYRSDALLTIGHIMENMRNAGVALEDIAPMGVSLSGSTYGEIMDGMSEKRLSELHPDVLARLEEMRELPFPEAYPSKADGYNYHMDLMIASPDGIHAYVNEDDLELPGWREQLEFFGYKPVPLPASYEGNRDRSERRTYTNWVMGEVDGKTVILLPTEAENPTELTANDREAIAAIKRHNPDVEVFPLGANTTHLFAGVPHRGSVRNWGPHCRTNVLPWILEPAPAETSTRGGRDDIVLTPRMQALLERVAELRRTTRG